MSVYSFGNFQFDTKQRLLFREDELVSLTPRAMDLLHLLLKNAGQVITKEQINTAVWQGVFVEESNIAKNISLLRRTLSTDSDEESPIRTIPKRGYQFTLPVTITDSPSAPALTESDGSASTSLIPRRNSRILAAVSGLLLLIIVVGSVLFVRLQRVDTRRPSLAVLPFGNLSGSPDTAWVSTALRETLVSDLDAGNSLRVIPDETVEQMQRDLVLQPSASLSKSTLGSINSYLGCTYIISGTYLKIGDSLRVDAYLQDVRSGKIISRTTQTRPVGELLSTITRTGDDLRAALGERPLLLQQQQQFAASVPSNPEALQLYAEGLQHLRAADGPGALSLFKRLTDLDPSYPLAHTALSETYALMGEDKQAVYEAKIAFDNSSKLPHEERLVIEADYEQATRRWPEAITAQQTLWREFSENNDYGVRLAHFQLLAGRPQDALSTVMQLEQGVGRNDPRVFMEEASIRYQTGDYSAMRNAAAKAEALAQAQQSHTLFGRARTLEGDALVHIGTAAQARTAFSEARSIAQAYDDKVGLMHALRRDGGALGTSDPRASIPIFEQDCAIAQLVGDAHEFANCRIAIGFAHQRLGEVAQARDIFSDALQLSQTLGDKRLVLVCLEVLGLIQTETAQWQQARESIDSAEALSTTTRSASMQHMILGDRGLMLAMHVNLADGRSLLERAVGLAREEKDPLGIARELDKLSSVLMLQVDNAALNTALQEECSLWNSTGQTILFTKCQINFAALLLDEGSPEKAQSILNGVKYDLNSIVPGFAAAHLRVDLAIQAKNIPEARSAAGLAATIAHEAADDVPIQIENLLLQAKLDIATGESRKAADELRNAMIEAKRSGLPQLQAAASHQLIAVHNSRNQTN